MIPPFDTKKVPDPEYTQTWAFSEPKTKVPDLMIFYNPKNALRTLKLWQPLTNESARRITQPGDDNVESSHANVDEYDMVRFGVTAIFVVA